MGLKAVLTKDEYEAQDDNMKALYKEMKGEFYKEGEFYLDVEPVNGFNLEPVIPLKTALASERNRAADLAKKIKTFDGFDVDKAKEWEQKIKEMENWTPEDKVKEQLLAREKGLEDKYKKEIDKREEKLKALNLQLDNHLVESAALGAIMEHKGIRDLAMPFVKQKLVVKEDMEGRKTVRVINEKGEEAITAQSGSTDPMTVSELVANMKAQDQFAPLFHSSGASGTGATGADRAGFSGGQLRFSREAMNDPARYRIEKERMEKQGATFDDIRNAAAAAMATK